MKKIIFFCIIVFSICVFSFNVDASKNKNEKFNEYFLSEGLILDFNNNFKDIKTLVNNNFVYLSIEELNGKEIFNKKIDLSKTKKITLNKELLRKSNKENVSIETYKINIIDEYTYIFGYYNYINIKDISMVKYNEKENLKKLYEDNNHIQLNKVKIDINEKINMSTKSFLDINNEIIYPQSGLCHTYPVPTSSIEAQTKLALVNSWNGVSNTFMYSSGNSLGYTTNFRMGIASGDLNGSFSQSGTTIVGTKKEEIFPANYNTQYGQYALAKVTYVYSDIYSACPLWDYEWIKTNIEVKPSEIVGGSGFESDKHYDNGISKTDLIALPSNNYVNHLQGAISLTSSFTSKTIENAVNLSYNSGDITTSFSLSSKMESTETLGFKTEYDNSEDPYYLYFEYDIKDTEGPKFTGFNAQTIKPTITIISKGPDRIKIRVTNNDIRSNVWIDINDSTPDIDFGLLEKGESKIYEFTGLNSATTYAIYAKAHIDDSFFYSYSNTTSKYCKTLGDDTISPSVFFKE